MTRFEQIMSEEVRSCREYVCRLQEEVYNSNPNRGELVFYADDLIHATERLEVYPAMAEHCRKLLKDSREHY